ncbi:unnamed protein product, partial [Discosporangium mesarthrocarpum]
MLLLVYVSNQWSRNLVYYVQNFDAPATEAAVKEFMNVGIGFDETQYGLLASFSFTILFSSFSLVAGRVVDVVSKKTVTVVSCLVWSLMTAGTALATTFPAVFALRVVQGSSQAFTTPAAYTLISEIFPPGSRGTANSIYSGGVYLGGALASLSLLLNSTIGWRDSHVVVAIGGFLTALLALGLVRESGWASEGAPAAGAGTAMGKKKGERQGKAAGADPKAVSKDIAGKGGSGGELGFREALGVVFETKTAVLLYVASALRFCAGFGIGVWSAPYFREVYPSFTSDYAVLNALVVGAGGLVSSFVGGLISDRFSTK